MKFVLTIEIGNEAMKDGRDINIALRKVGQLLVAFDEGGIKTRPWDRIVDENGNKVGKWEVKR